MSVGRPPNSDAEERSAPIAPTPLPETREDRLITSDLSREWTARIRPAGVARDVEAAAPPAASTLPEPTWIEDRGEIGAGGMGRVHHAYDRHLRRSVAMKLLLRRDTTASRRFVREAQITAQLDHPNIPPVHGIWATDAGDLCFAMKLVRGRTLSEVLAARTPAGRTEQDIEELLGVFLKVCDAVSFAHSRGVVHRDLKPGNIMLGTHGQVLVMDWGCALLRGGTAGSGADSVTIDGDPSVVPGEEADVAVGTPCYMAPEQALAMTSAIDERTDVYLLGGLLYCILTGSPPHPGRDIPESILAAQQGRVVPPEQLEGMALPPVLCRIAMRALAPDPSERYQSVHDLQEDLVRCRRAGWWFPEATFEPGRLIVGQGDAADAAYIITSGTCEVFRTENDKEIFLRRMGPGEAFGETAILASRPRSASVRAVDRVTVTVVTRESLERAIGTTWASSFVRSLAERFHDLDARLARLRTAEPAGA